MSDRSPNLDLPYILAAQAQKHVTHNEALDQLDALVQLSVEGFNLTTPPAAPSDGSRYAVGNGATGAWVGQAGKIAWRSGGGWLFLAPLAGWVAWGRSEAEMRVWSEGNWVTFGASTLALLGINTGADATNKLSVASTASLFSHVGNGHQIKINKAAAGDTASVVFQSNWTGHAEFGLAGSTNFSIKVSPDGSAWTTALQIDGGTGQLTGAAVQQTVSDLTPGRLMRVDFGYGKANAVGIVAQSGGVPTGALIEKGNNANGLYARWADGTQKCWGSSAYPSVATNTATGGAFRSAIFTQTLPVAFVAAPVVSLTTQVTAGTHDATTVLATVATGSFDAYHVKSTTGTAQGRVVHFTATGRWF